MDSDFMGKLQQVLSDPEAMAKITSIASGLGAMPPSQSPPQAEAVQEAPQTASSGFDIQNALSALAPQANGDPRVSLLYSLKPLLREEKRERVDALARALAIASMMKNFRK